MPADRSAGTPPEAISRLELIALIAMLMATVAFSVDAMLPALPDIAADVAGGDVTRVALVVAVFMAGMGLGTLVAGPLSDAHGRHPVALGGAAIYIPSALMGALANSLEILLIARFLQGIGASGPRIVAMAIVRDLFSGRQMAQTISFVMTIFTVVPVLAPTMGAVIAGAFGWRAIFVCFAVFSILSILWLRLRQPETLPPEARRPFRIAALKSGLRDVLGSVLVRRAILAQSLVYAVLFICLMSSQPVIDAAFGRGASFHYWFGGVALVSSAASFLNAAIVVRLGMVRVIRSSLLVTAVYAVTYLVSLLTLGTDGALPFALFLILLVAGFSLAGLCIGNLNALAMQPLGHVAGLAASTISAISTSLGALLAAPTTLLFDGTPLPATLGIIAATVAAMALSRGLTDV